MIRSNLSRVAVVVLTTVAVSAYGQDRASAEAASIELERPTALTFAGSLVEAASVPVVEASAVDIDSVTSEDKVRQAAGMAPRFAMPNEVFLTPETSGVWERVSKDTSVWRLRIASPGAVSLNLGFTQYQMPEGGKLLIYASDMSEVVRPFTARDNAAHGELWTPVVRSDELVVEVTIPDKVRGELELLLTSINVGYRGFAKDTGGVRSGWCNVDVVCSQGDAWRDEIPAIAVISTGGSLFCTGFMVNNTSQDETPYFMTANHCLSSGAASLVVYWNYETSVCGGSPNGQLNQWQSGAYLRATYSPSDFTLVELDSDPNPAWGITFAGWDKSGANASSAVGIHHPSVDEKRISFEYQSTTTTSFGGTSSPGDGTHVRVADWDVGTTEGGSSGSPLFNQNHHVIGQLGGGYAACGNNLADWYGKFGRSWTGGGSSSNRLSSWLDSAGTGATTLDTLVPGAGGLTVTPSSGLDSEGDPGGPFSPNSKVYTLENGGGSSINYSVTKSQSWVSISNASGTLGGGATTNVTVSINANANALGEGDYSDTVYFTNTTDGSGNTSRGVTLQVGGPQLAYSFPMNSNPGWTLQSQWAFGQPTGSGGQYGGSDPTSGHTGNYVYGYNLSGDYANNLSERHLTSTAIDCSDLSDVTLRFWRWLGVEQPTYDHAYVRVSNNGSSWTTIWENGTEVTDSSWNLREYDISSVADNRPTVYVRWTMGTTDGSWRYCGWNIDDVEIWGLGGATCDDGVLNQGESRIDCGGPCPACECTSDGACSDGAFCTGTETCDSYGQCQNGSAPCGGGQWCDESGNTCRSYGDGDFDQDRDVDLGDFAMFQACFGQIGTGNCSQGNMTGSDGTIDLADFTSFVSAMTGP